MSSKKRASVPGLSLDALQTLPDKSTPGENFERVKRTSHVLPPADSPVIQKIEEKKRDKDRAEKADKDKKDKKDSKSKDAANNVNEAVENPNGENNVKKTSAKSKLPDLPVPKELEKEKEPKRPVRVSDSSENAYPYPSEEHPGVPHTVKSTLNKEKENTDAVSPSAQPNRKIKEASEAARLLQNSQNQGHPHPKNLYVEKNVEKNTRVGAGGRPTHPNGGLNVGLVETTHIKTNPNLIELDGEVGSGNNVKLDAHSDVDSDEGVGRLPPHSSEDEDAIKNKSNKSNSKNSQLNSKNSKPSPNRPSVPTTPLDEETTPLDDLTPANERANNALDALYDNDLYDENTNPLHDIIENELESLLHKPEHERLIKMGQILSEVDDILNLLVSKDAHPRRKGRALKGMALRADELCAVMQLIVHDARDIQRGELHLFERYCLKSERLADFLVVGNFWKS